MNLGRPSYDVPIEINPKAYQTFLFDLDSEIKVEKRVVISFLSLLGEIGGIKEVLSIIIAILIGSIQSKTYVLNRVEQLYRVHRDDRNDFDSLQK